MKKSYVKRFAVITTIVLFWMLLLNCSKEYNFVKLIEAGDIDKVEEAITNGANVNVGKKDGEPPIIVALASENPEIALLLIEKGADVNVKSKAGESVLITALSQGDVDVFKALISKGADINVKSVAGESLSTILATKDFIDFIHANQEKGVDIKNEPSVTSTTIATIKYNEKAAVIETNSKFEVINNIEADWWKVLYNDKVGWIFGGFISYFEASKSIEEIYKSFKEMDIACNDIKGDLLANIQGSPSEPKPYSIGAKTIDILGIKFIERGINSEVTISFEIVYNDPTKFGTGRYRGTGSFKKIDIMRRNPKNPLSLEVKNFKKA